MLNLSASRHPSVKVGLCQCGASGCGGAGRVVKFPARARSSRPDARPCIMQEVEASSAATSAFLHLQERNPEESHALNDHRRDPDTDSPPTLRPREDSNL